MDKISPLFLALLANGPVRLDGVTYYLHNGKPRACKSKRGSRQYRTEEEEKSSNRFTEVRKMWRIYRRAIGTLPVWRVMAREMGVAKSDALFHSTNGSCFRPGEGVWAFPTFRFSVGTLDAPVITSVKRDKWKVTIQWENNVDCTKIRLSDQVYLGYFYDTLSRSPQFMGNIDAHRADGEITVTIPSVEQPDGTPLHLYLFFGNEKQERFSPSEYVEV